MRASLYNLLKRRRAAWRAELRKPKTKYTRKEIQATIAAISAEMTQALKERAP